MAKVAVEFDTQTKELSLSMDGEKIDNVSSINLSTCWDDPDEYCMYFTTRDETSKEDDGYVRQTMVSATETDHGYKMKKSGAVAHEKYSDFVTKKEESEISLRSILNQYRAR